MHESEYLQNEPSALFLFLGLEIVLVTVLYSLAANTCYRRATIDINHLSLIGSQVNVVTPVGRQMSVFNSQARIQIGGKWHQVMGRVERPFLGVLAGLVYNKVRVLEDVRERRPGTDIMGHVSLLDTIPYNYRQLNTALFERMQRTETSNSPGVEDDIIVRVGQKCGGQDSRYLSAECFKYSGDGDELITPVYLAPTVPQYRVGADRHQAVSQYSQSHISAAGSDNREGGKVARRLL